MQPSIPFTLCWFLFLLFGQPSCLWGQWTGRGGSKGNYQTEPIHSNANGQIPAWSVALQASDSETVTDGRTVYVTALDFAENGEDAQSVQAYDISNGEKIWEANYPERSFTSQDISAAYPVRPLATPRLIADYLVCVGYGGSVRCLNHTTGALVWTHDLVEEYQADPVQYGAATSPWSDGEQVLVGCGGPLALVISFDLKTGERRWMAGMGPASYCSFVELEIDPSLRHVVYAAGDEIVGIDPSHGEICWRFPYPQAGLTNAVTPIAVECGHLLIGGQGVQGTRLLRVSKEADGQFSVETLWKSGRQQPFYCNWVQLKSHHDRVVGFAGKTLYVLNWRNGEILSQTRGWNDCNITAGESQFWAIRGDGYLGEFLLNDDQPQLVRGDWVLHDRVWSAPVIDGNRVMVRGRNGMRLIDLRSLPAAEIAPVGSNVTAMDAMYGNQLESVALLLEKAKEEPLAIVIEDYQKVVEDRSVEIGEGAYGKIFDALWKVERFEMVEKIAAHWLEVKPHSNPAWQWWVRALRAQGKGDTADREELQRMVEVEFHVRVPESVNSQDHVVVVGNCSALGDWNGDGLKLQKGVDGRWHGTARVPKGDLQFKVTGGTWDRVETREDGRSISNRRIRIRQSQRIEISVAAFQDKKGP